MSVHIQHKPGALLAQSVHLRSHQLVADASTVARAA